MPASYDGDFVHATGGALPTNRYQSAQFASRCSVLVVIVASNAPLGSEVGSGTPIATEWKWVC